MSKDELNKAAGALRYELGKDKAAHDKCKGLRHDTDRLEILAKYIIDPSDASKLMMSNITSKISIDGSRGKRMWLSLNRMAGPLCFNSMEDAEIIAAECESRDSPYEGMRKAGKKEYLVELSEEILGAP